MMKESRHPVPRARGVQKTHRPATRGWGSHTTVQTEWRSLGRPAWIIGDGQCVFSARAGGLEKEKVGVCGDALDLIWRVSASHLNLGDYPVFGAVVDVALVIAGVIAGEGMGELSS